MDQTKVLAQIEPVSALRNAKLEEAKIPTLYVRNLNDKIKPDGKI